MTGEGFEVGRLTLRLRGVSAKDGERVARLVADGLAADPGTKGGHDIKAQVAAQGTPEEIAQSVIVELRRQLEAAR